jgi:hypothetical protein
MNIEKETVQGTLRHGHTTVGTSRVQLTALQLTAMKGVTIRAPGADDPVPNSDPVWVGSANVTADSAATGGIPILPGASIFIPVEQLNSLYVISTAIDQDVAWMGV